MLIVEIKYDACPGDTECKHWHEFIELGPNVSIVSAMRIPMNVPPMATLRIRRLTPDELIDRHRRRDAAFDDYDGAK